MARSSNRKLFTIPDSYKELITLIQENSITKLVISHWDRRYSDYQDHYWFAFLRFSLEIEDKNQEMAFIANIFKAIQGNVSITELIIDDISIRSNAKLVFNAFCEMIKSNKNLKLIEINGSDFDNTIDYTYFRHGYLIKKDEFRINLSWFLDALLMSTSIACIKFDCDTFTHDPLDKAGDYATSKYCEFLGKFKKYASLRLSFNSGPIQCDKVLKFISENNISVDELSIISPEGNPALPDFSCIKALNQYLRQSTLKSLVLKGKSFNSSEDAEQNKAQLEVILNSTSLRKIYIQKNGESLSDFSLAEVAPNEIREELILNDFEYSTEFFEKLANIVKNSLVLKKLTLGNESVQQGFNGYNKPTNIEFNLFLQEISVHQTLEIFEIIGGQWLPEKRLGFIYEMVKQRIKPLTLNLSDLYYLHMEGISGNYLEMLGRILSHPNIKKFIYAPLCRHTLTFGTKTLHPIIQAIKSNASLQVLDLRGNCLNNEDAKLIAQAILSNPYSAIQDVMLDGNRVDEVHQKLVKNAIKKVKANVGRAIQPFMMFSSLPKNRNSVYCLPSEITEYIIQQGLFNTIGSRRRPGEINELASKLMTKARLR